ARHEIAALHPIEKIHRMLHDFAEELVPNVVYDSVAYPGHVVSVAVGAETSDCHHYRNSEANPDDRIDPRSDVQYFSMHHHRFRIGRGAVKNETRDLENRYR